MKKIRTPRINNQRGSKDMQTQFAQIPAKKEQGL
jgi:hypothetical protein